MVMDTTAFDHGPADAADHGTTIRGILRALDEDHLLPVVGALLAVALLMRLAVVIVILFVIVALWCFAIAWIALFWTQTVLFEWAAMFLEACMREKLVARKKTVKHVEDMKHNTQVAADAARSEDSAADLPVAHADTTQHFQAKLHVDAIERDTSTDTYFTIAESSTVDASKTIAHTGQSSQAQQEHRFIGSLEDAEAYIREIAGHRGTADAREMEERDGGTEEMELHAEIEGKDNSTVEPESLAASEKPGIEIMQPGGKSQKYEESSTGERPGEITKLKLQALSEVKGNTRQNSNTQAPHMRVQSPKQVNPFAGSGALADAKLFMADVKKSSAFKRSLQRSRQHEHPAHTTELTITQAVPQKGDDKLQRSPVVEYVSAYTPADTGVIPPHMRRSMEARAKSMHEGSPTSTRKTSFVSDQTSTYHQDRSVDLTKRIEQDYFDATQRAPLQVTEEPDDEQRIDQPALAEARRVLKDIARGKSRLNIQSELPATMPPLITWSARELEGLRETCGLIPASLTEQSSSGAKPLMCLKYPGWAHDSINVPDNHQSCVPSSKGTASVLSYSTDVLKSLRVAGKSSEQLNLLPKHVRSTSGLKMFQCLKCWKWAHESAEASSGHKRCVRCSVLEGLGSQEVAKVLSGDSKAAETANAIKAGQYQAYQTTGRPGRAESVRAHSADNEFRTGFAILQPQPSSIDANNKTTPSAPGHSSTSGLAPTAHAFFVPSKSASRENSSEEAIERVHRPLFEPQLPQQKQTPLSLTSSLGFGGIPPPLPGLGMVPTSRLPARPSVQGLFDPKPHSPPRFVPASKLSSLTVLSPTRPSHGPTLPEWFMQEATALGPLNSVHYAPGSFGIVPAEAASLAVASYQAGLLAAGSLKTQPYPLAAPAPVSSVVDTFDAFSMPSNDRGTPVNQTPYFSEQDSPQVATRQSLKLFRPPQETLPIAPPAPTARRISLAVPIKKPTRTELDTQDPFTNPPAIDLAQKRWTPPRPPGLGPPKRTAQAAFDALVSDGGASSAGAQAAKLIDVLDSPGKPQHQENVAPMNESSNSASLPRPEPRDVLQTSNEQWLKDEFPALADVKIESTRKAGSKIPTGRERTEIEDKKQQPASLKLTAESFKPPSSMVAQERRPKSSAVVQTANDQWLKDDFPTLADANISATSKAEPTAVTNKERSELKDKKKAARAALTDAWFEREEIRKKLAQTFELELAMTLQSLTSEYNEKRNALQGLMGTGVLNDDDAKVFPGLGKDNLAAPKHRPRGYTEWQGRRTTQKRSPNTPDKDPAIDAAPAKEAAPLESEEPEEKQEKSDELNKLIATMETAKTLRREAMDYFNQPRPQTNISYATWKEKGETKRRRADKLYRTKLQALEDYYPNGMPGDLRAKYPYIL